MEIIPTVINTVLLIAIFWYQKNRNKVLADRISEQSNLIKETKDVVLQQAQAIDSQKKVVDTAIEYSKAFDVNKFETIIKRETEIEFKEIIQEQKDKLNKHQQTQEHLLKGIDLMANQMASEYIVPLSVELLALLLLQNNEDQERILTKLPANIAASFKEAIEGFDKSQTGIINSAIANK